MHCFEVWAPRPGRVDVVVDGVTEPMQPVGRGWWRAEVARASPGSRYAFSLDGGPPRPDPRSGHQPDGIDGPSAVVDHASFRWTDASWRGLPLSGAVLYEMHIGTFSAAGTFDGAIEHLDHLVALGVDAVELLPVAEFSGSRGWGYDGVSLFAPHRAYGGPDGLKRFVDACHAAGIGVVMDVVYNHLGPVGNHLGEFGPYFTDRIRTPWGDAVSFDGPDSDEVRRFVIDNALQWLREYHCDGLRLDAVHAIADDAALHILEELGAAVHALGAHLRKPLFVIAESDLNDPRLVRSCEAGGMGLDAAWADDWHHAVHVALTGETEGYYRDYVEPEALRTALEQAWVLDGRWSRSRRRAHGRPPTGLPPDRFVVCTQNHDQVGNRAQGRRTAALMSEGRCLVAAALLLTSPFVPMLFQGEEWAASTRFQYFTDHADPELARAVRDGRRSEFAAFGWNPADVPDPQDLATFERSKLDWSDLDRLPHTRVLRWYRTLIGLRRRLPELTDPRQPVVSSLDDGLLLVERGPVRLAANLGSALREIHPRPGSVLLAHSDGIPDEGADGVALQVDSVVLWYDAAD